MREHPHTARYVTLAVIMIVVVSLLFPLLEGLGDAGFFGEKTYLVVLQDNSEMRGTGGFISLAGVLTMKNGHIEKLQYYSGHMSPEMQAVVNVDGPEAFTSFFGFNAANLSDSNVQYDFASFAPKLQSDWYNVTGQKIDCIIAFDFTAVEKILSITGPINASGEVITDRNVFHILEYYASTSRAQMPDLLSTLTYGTFSLIVDASVPQKLALYSAFRDLANEKHLFIYPDQGLLMRNASGGTSKPPESDFVSVIDYNLGNAKADLGINRSIDYHVQLLPDGSSVANLTLTYANGDWWASDLFTQAIVPPGATLMSAQNVTREFNGPEITNGTDFTVFSSRFVVSPYSAASITYQYTLPDKVYGNGIGSHYDLYVVKQGGINSYGLNASVQLPAGATLVHAENVGSNRVFTDDAHVSVVYM